MSPSKAPKKERLIMSKIKNSWLGWALALSLLIAAPSLAAPQEQVLLKFEQLDDIGAGEFAQLTGVCVDTKNIIYACGDQAVKVFDQTGAKVAEWKTPGKALCMAVDHCDFVYVGGVDEKDNPFIARFDNDKSGKLLTTWGEKGSGMGQLGLPTGLITYPNYLIVSDAPNRCLHIYTLIGGFVRDIGRREKAKRGQFATCQDIFDIAVDRQGKLHIAHLGAHRVEMRNLEGGDKTYFGKAGKEVADFSGSCNPTNIAVFTKGHIVTTEKTIPRVKVFTPGGKKLLAVFGEDVFDPACKNMDVAVDAKFRIYVVDNVANCLRVFAPPKG